MPNLQTDCRAGDLPFDEFCDDFGYDNDSRSAYKTWEECRDQMFALRRFFAADYDLFLDTDWEDL